MTKETILKGAGLSLLAVVAVYTQYNRPQKAAPMAEAAVDSVSAVPQATAGKGVDTKEAVQGFSRQEAVESREPFELTAEEPPLEVIRTLLTAPFGAEPGETLSEKTNWRVLAYPPDYCAPPAYSKTFRRKGPGMEINLYSYTVPSLTEAKELVLSGDLKIFKVVEQAEVMELLKKSGFDPKPTEKHLSSPGGRNWSGVMELAKGDLSGLWYYEPHGMGTVLRIKLEHKDTGKYSVRPPSVKEFTKMQEIIPGLVEDLEKTGAKKVLGEDWDEIKPMLLSGPTLNKTVPVEKLLDARAACLATPEGIDGAPFLVLAKYLVDAALVPINRDFRPYTEDGKEPVPPPGLKLLEEYGVAYELAPIMRESYSAVNNTLMPAYDSFPDSYWGQYAFMTEMESGFPTTGSDDEMPVVMKKGEEFLAAHPDSPFLPRVLFLLGKANETAYTVGLSPFKYTDLCTHSYCVELERTLEKHRLDAIKHYTRLLTLPGAKEYEEHLKYILPRLKTKGSSYCAFYINCNPC
ncbi:MAG: hypothetical protein AUJ51_08400 [Elusimicrobia bacterium CG1_02_56_21]|nr:MAG: hypothetical protein AUJ51_08400 [Elusimicrobia bacterium CG1_02_56_21]